MSNHSIWARLALVWIFAAWLLLIVLTALVIPLPDNILIKIFSRKNLKKKTTRYGGIAFFH
jgi:hypothetical protein